MRILSASALVAISVWSLPVGAGEGELFTEINANSQFIGIARDFKTFKPIDGVEVKATYGTQVLTTSTDAEGRFRIEGFTGDDYDPNHVTLACAKQGYKTFTVIRRNISPDSKTPGEIECVSSRS